MNTSHISPVFTRCVGLGLIRSFSRFMTVVGLVRDQARLHKHQYGGMTLTNICSC